MPAPRARRLAAALILGALLVAGVLVNRSVTADHLSTGNGMSRFPGEPVDDPFGDDEDVVEVAYIHNRDYSFDFTLTNDSRWPTRILAFPTASGAGLLRRTGVAVDDTPFVDDGGFRRFRPFTLGAGEAVVVRVRSRFDGCADFGPNSSAGYSSIAVRHRTLWATRTHLVELPTGIQVPAPGPGDCPAR